MIVTFLPPWISVSLLLNKLCPCGHVETGSFLYRCFVFHGISLLIEADVMLLTLSVVLPTPHDYSGTFQGGYSSGFIASRMTLIEGARRSLLPLEAAYVCTYI